MRKFWELLLTVFFAASLLCAPISSSDYVNNAVIPELFNPDSEILDNLDCIPSSFSEEDVKLIQEALNDPSINYENYNIETDFLLEAPILGPHAVSNISAQSTNNSDIVARLQIFAWDGSNGGSSGSSNNGGINLGHAFIVITNVSDHNIYAGGLYIKPNTGLTIGTWGSEKEHKGLWYCMEGYRYYNYKDFSGSYSMAVMLNQYWLDKANEIIRKGDSWSALTNNCSSFAARVWNAVCSDQLNAGWPVNTPGALKDSIASYGKNKYGIDAEIPVYYAAYYGEPPVKSQTIH